MRRKVLALLVLGGAVVSSVHAEQISPMGPLFQEAAQFWGVPVAWTQAIADVESGHNPWALNIEGKGYQFASKDKALAMAKQADAEGRSFDLSWLSGNRTIQAFMINHHERREVHAKEASQLQP